MKKILIVLMTVIMLASSLSACGNSNEKLIAEQDEIIAQLGYSYYNQLLIVSRELNNGERIYNCLGFDNNGNVNKLVICHFFTDKDLYQVKYDDVKRRETSDECKIVRTYEDTLAFVYNDPLSLGEVEGMTFLEAQQHYINRGWTYVKKASESDSGEASSSES